MNQPVPCQSHTRLMRQRRSGSYRRSSLPARRVAACSSRALQASMSNSHVNVVTSSDMQGSFLTCDRPVIGKKVPSNSAHLRQIVVFGCRDDRFHTPPDPGGANVNFYVKTEARVKMGKFMPELARDIKGTFGNISCPFGASWSLISTQNRPRRFRSLPTFTLIEPFLARRAVRGAKCP